MSKYKKETEFEIQKATGENSSAKKKVRDTLKKIGFLFLYFCEGFIICLDAAIIAAMVSLGGFGIFWGVRTGDRSYIPGGICYILVGVFCVPIFWRTLRISLFADLVEDIKSKRKAQRTSKERR